MGYSSGSVENCTFSGTVNGSGNSVGGVVGYNDNSSIVENCYNTGSVSGPDSGSNINVGGVVGDNSGLSTVNNCYNTGSVIGLDSDSSSVGGVVGQNNNTVTGCYFLQTTGVNESLQGIGNDEAIGATAESVNDLDTLCQKFTSDPWTISDTLKRPVLTSNHEDDGSKDHPYEIFIATQLENFRDLVNRGGAGASAHAKLMNNIDLSSVCGESNSWTPIGTSEENAYTGTFNGQNFKISGLYIKNTSSDTDYQGLFGFVGSEGTVQNLTVTGSVNVSGNSSVVGGVVGWNQGGSVQNCYNTGGVNVTGNDGRVGGVVGWNSGNVTNCYNTDSITVTGSGGRVGGVVGHNAADGNVTGCYFLQTTEVNDKLQGIGDGSGTSSNVEPKTAEDFHSGEVAWLLENGQADGSSQVWGQNIKDGENDNYPQLRALDADTPQVYKVVFMNDSEEHDAKYANSGMTVDLPATEPTKEGYTFSYWQDKAGTQVTEPISVNSDTTYYAKWTPVAEPHPDPEPTPEPEEPPYSGKYSYEVFTSVGDNGTLTVDRYAIEGDTVTIEIAPDQAYKLDDLSVTANGKDVELTANGDGTYSFTMPSADVKITATFAEDLDWTEPEPEEPSTDVSDIFIDVAPNAWYKDAVQYAYAGGLMTGVSDTEFAPEATTTRAMIVSTLARLENVTSAESAGFADVSANDWYATAVNWAANVGVVNGYEDNTFRPNTAITREQLAAILMNYAAYKGEDVSNRASLATYTDQPSTWAEEAVSWAVAEGLINGVTNDQLQPQGNATRAQVAAILQRFLDK